MVGASVDGEKKTEQDVTVEATTHLLLNSLLYY